MVRMTRASDVPSVCITCSQEAHWWGAPIRGGGHAELATEKGEKYGSVHRSGPPTLEAAVGIASLSHGWMSEAPSESMKGESCLFASM